MLMLLQLQNITKGYGVPGMPGYRKVLKELNLTVEKGEKIAIVGPSGSGKTTLLNLIGALDNPELGQIIFDGKYITEYSGNELARFRNRNLGFIFQLHHLMPQLTLLENVLLPFLAGGNNISAEQLDWAEFLIQKVGIWDQREQKPAQLSGGECQRTAVVRALVNKPQLLLADEPTGALDEENAEILADLLDNIHEEQKVSMVVVTHDSTLANRMDKSYKLKSGKLI